MTQYRDLADYIMQRAKALEMSASTLSEALGYGRSYINSVVNNQFQISQRRCREIAAFFGDDPNIILALAGYYEPVKNNEPHLRDIEQAARSLPPALRVNLLTYARFLKEQSIAYDTTYDTSSNVVVDEEEKEKEEETPKKLPEG